MSWITDCAVWEGDVAPTSPAFLIPWAHLWFAGGPEFQAFGYADNTSATNWPDEIGTADATSGSGVYRAADSAINFQPSVIPAGGGANGKMTPGAPMSVAVPYSIIVLCQLSAVGAGSYILDGGNAGSTGNRVLLKASPFSSSAWGIEAGTERTGGTASTGIKAMRILITSGNDLLTVNGSTVISGVDAGSNTFQGITIGGPSGAPMNGRVSLVGVYSGDITGHANWAAFQAWVLSAYGVSLS